MDKSSFFIHHKVDLHIERRIHKITNMRKGSFPCIYLGCPVFYGRRKSIYYADLVKKVMNRIMSWQNRLLTFGGRYILIAHVLQTMPIYLLSAMNPSKGIINQLHKLFAKFFWNNATGSRNKHWAAWDKLCLPKEEGGIGFRSLHDISNALFAKLWWSFRTSNSLWSVYMWNKYCKKLHPVIAQARGGSNAWKKMVLVREQVEHNIWWQMKNGSSSFWFENWTKLGALYYVITESNFDAEVEVKEYVARHRWNLERLSEVLPEEVVNHIQQHIKVPLEVEGMTKRGGFSMEGRHLHQAILTWWTTDVNTKLQAIFRAVPAIIMLELWKMKNAVKHGNNITYSRLVKWLTPNNRKLKCNTDGASRGNPGRSSYAFCIRNHMGGLIYAQS
ncbi:uncharacterized protein LOC132057691 [Lycium ferocissimum]|uniref:uncharacterized protein LOC132057691 n=1 Tax=Lycium ferocissimum TaxID=112874 RepID=UPI002815CE0D|nr:uncharacterized protein LOC132057691 [Lycium ferocissimum]